MRLKLTVLAAAVVALAALAVIPAATGARTAHATKVVLTVHCTANFVNPTPTKTKGVDFGFIKCTHYGKGVQVAFYNETIGAGGKLTVTGTSTGYAALGTQSGPYKFSGTLNGASATVTGTGKIVRG